MLKAETRIQEISATDTEKRIVEAGRNTVKQLYRNALACGKTYAASGYLGLVSKKMDKADQITDDTYESWEPFFKNLLATRIPVSRYARTEKLTVMRRLGVQCYNNAFVELGAGAACGWISPRDEAYGFGMVGMVMSDCADHIRLSVALMEGDMARVKRYMSMDTASREKIPSNVWKWLLNNT